MTFFLFKVDSAWIAYNKPKSPELANEYAGFLMALGLNGHLTKLATLNIHDYLTKVYTQRRSCLHLEFHSTNKPYIHSLFISLQVHTCRRILGLMNAFYLNSQFTVDSTLNYCFSLRYKHVRTSAQRIARKTNRNELKHSLHKGTSHLLSLTCTKAYTHTFFSR